MYMRDGIRKNGPLSLIPWMGRQYCRNRPCRTAGKQKYRKLHKGMDIFSWAGSLRREDGTTVSPGISSIR